MGDRAPRRPPGAGAVRRQLPHPLPRQRPRRDPRHPGREAVLPAARRRPAHGHERAAVEPPPPAVPRPGRLRPAGVPRPRARRRLHRAAVARGVQRRVPPGRPAPRGRRRPALAARAGRGGAPPTWPTTRAGASDRSGGPALPDTPQLHGFAFAELAVDDECERADRPHARRARVRPHRHRTAPSRCSCGRTARRRVLLNAQPSACTAPPSRRVGVEVDDPTGRRASGPTALLAPVLPRTRGAGRGGPVGGRRTGRHGGVLLPHRRRGRLAHRLPRRRRRPAPGIRLDHPHRPRRADPAVRQLRRGGAVLPQPAGAGDPARVGGRGAVRPGPQPDRRRPRSGRCGSG